MYIWAWVNVLGADGRICWIFPVPKSTLSCKLLNKLSGFTPNAAASAGVIFDKLPTAFISNIDGKFVIFGLQIYGCELL